MSNGNAMVMDYFQNFYVWLISTVMKTDRHNEQKKYQKKKKVKKKVSKAE